MAYLLSADVFIRAQNDHYGFDFCPGFWDWLDQANRQGHLFSIDAVYAELAAGEDELARWVRSHRQLFLPLTAGDLAWVATVNQWAVESLDYEAAAKVEFASSPDSVLIGQALSGQHTVVAHERISAGRRRIKIPDAAAALGVSCLNPFQMLRAEQACFTLCHSPVPSSA